MVKDKIYLALGFGACIALGILGEDRTIRLIVLSSRWVSHALGR